MLEATVRSTIEFMAVAIEDDGSNKVDVQIGEYKKLTANFTTIRSTKEDVTKALTVLKGITPFTQQQAKELRTYLTAQQSSEVSVGTTSGPSKTAHFAHKTQIHAQVQDYLTEEKWDRLHTAMPDVRAMIEVVTDVYIDIGLLWPAPKPTKLWTIAFLYAVRGGAYSPDALYASLGDLTDSIVYKRKRPRAGAPSHIPVYPDINKFLESYPTVFAESKPVPSKIDVAQIHEVLRYGSCRGTNKLVRDNALTSRPGHGNRNPKSSGPPTEDMCMQKMLMGMMTAMLGQSNQGGLSASATSQGGSQRRKRMLGDDADQEAAAGHVNDDDPKTPAKKIPALMDRPPKESSVDGKSTEAGPASAEKHNCQDNTDRIDDPEPKGGVSGLGAMIEATKRLTKTVSKKPAAAPKKGGYAEHAKANPPCMPKLNEHHPVFIYNDCKIYTSLKEKKWRVVPYKVTLNDFAFPFGAEPTKSWASLINYCKDPIIPKHWKRL
jgi:hypothetical protein